MKQTKVIVEEKVFTPDGNRDKLDKLINNMNELQINNLVEVINVYITLSSLEQIKIRINNPDDYNPLHETEMRGLARFQDFIAKFIKDWTVV